MVDYAEAEAEEYSFQEVKPIQYHYGFDDW